MQNRRSALRLLPLNARKLGRFGTSANVAEPAFGARTIKDLAVSHDTPPVRVAIEDALLPIGHGRHNRVAPNDRPKSLPYPVFTRKEEPVRPEPTIGGG